MGKNKNRKRRQQFPPITAAAIAAARGEKTSGGEVSAPVVEEVEPTSHAVQVLQTAGEREDAAWDWFAKDEYRRAVHSGKTRKQVSRSLRRDSFLAGFRAGQRDAASRF